MNRDSVQRQLMLLLSGILYHKQCFAEILNLVAGTGFELSFFKKLTASLLTLNSLGITATNAKEFEPIERGIYSMHLSNKGYNIRILYSFMRNGAPVLLLAFYERGGKRKTDYSSYIEPALSRLAEMRG